MIVDADSRIHWTRGLPFLLCGSVSVTLGGIAAAVTRPIEWEQGPWVAAFLVLVMGVGQIGLGMGQALLSRETPTRVTVAIECTLWNLGSLAVMVGTIIEAPLLVSLGGLILFAALALLAGTGRATGSQHAWLHRAHRGLVLLLLVSVPIGMTLSWMRT